MGRAEASHREVREDASGSSDGPEGIRLAPYPRPIWGEESRSARRRDFGPDLLEISAVRVDAPLRESPAPPRCEDPLERRLEELLFREPGASGLARFVSNSEEVPDVGADPRDAARCSVALKDHPRSESLNAMQRPDFLETVAEYDEGNVHYRIPGDEDPAIGKKDSDRIRSMSRQVEELDLFSSEVERSSAMEEMVRLLEPETARPRVLGVTDPLRPVFSEKLRAGYMGPNRTAVETVRDRVVGMPVSVHEDLGTEPATLQRPKHPTGIPRLVEVVHHQDALSGNECDGIDPGAPVMGTAQLPDTVRDFLFGERLRDHRLCRGPSAEDAERAPWREG